MVFAYILRRWHAREGYVDLVLADNHFLDEGFYDLPLIFGRERRPALMEVGGLVDDVIGGELVHAQEIDLGFETGKLGLKLRQALLGRLHDGSESLDRYLVGEVKPVGLGNLVLNPLDFIPVNVQKARLLGEIARRFLQMPIYLHGLPKEIFEFVPDDAFQIRNRNLVIAFAAEVFGRPRVHIHLRAAGAMGDAAEKMRGSLAWLLPCLQLLLHNPIGLVPEFLRHDGRAFSLAPLAFGLGLRLPRFLRLTHPVEEIDAFGTRTLENPHNRCVSPNRAFAGAVSGRVQSPRHLPLAAALHEQPVCLAADGRFRLLHDELPVFPFISIRSAPVDGLAELGAGKDGRVHALGDFLALPLREYAQKMEEHPASGCARVDGFGEGNQIGLMLVEIVGEVFQLAAVA